MERDLVYLKKKVRTGIHKKYIYRRTSSRCIHKCNLDVYLCRHFPLKRRPLVVPAAIGKRLKMNETLEHLLYRLKPLQKFGWEKLWWFLWFFDLRILFYSRHFPETLWELITQFFFSVEIRKGFYIQPGVNIRSFNIFTFHMAWFI